MADSLTRVNKEKMQTAIDNYKSRKDQMVTTCYKISDAVRVLDGNWDGDASEVFKSQFDSMFNNLKQSETAMTTLIGRLEGALSTYEGTEVDIQALFESIQEGLAYISTLL